MMLQRGLWFRSGAWFVIMVSAWVVASPSALAGLSVSPGRISATVKAGAAHKGEFMVTNDGDTAIEVQVEPENWSQGMGGSRGPAPWMKVNPKSLSLAPNSQATVRYLVRVPKDAPAELRTQVFFASQEPGSSLRKRLGVIVYVAVEGRGRISAAITNVTPFSESTVSGAKRPDKFEVAIGVKNTGDVHIVPQGQVVLKDAEGRPMASLELKPGWGLLPGEESTYRAIAHGKALQPGACTVDVRLSVGGDLGKPVVLRESVPAVVDADGAIHIAN